MTTLKVSLPDKELLLSWNHPWRRVPHRGLENVFMKLTQCFMSEYKGDRRGRDGKLKPFIRHILSTRIKWPLYSTDGTKGHTLRMNTDVLSKNKARKLTLKRALSEAGLSQWERTQVWNAYLQRFEPNITLPPTIPPAVLTRSLFAEANAGVADREVVPARIIQFPTRPLTDPARLLGPGVFIAPGSELVH